MRFLVDANVLSEPTKPAPSQRVVEWLRANELELAINPIVLGELRYGILLLPASRRRKRLQEWFDEGVERLHVLDFDAQSAMVWADLLMRLKKKGLAMSVKDSLIAATALVHGLILATRNVGDFRAAGVRLFNPFGNTS